MGMFSNLKRSSDIEESKDYIGGSFTLDSDIYPAKIVYAYADQFKSGARFIAVKLHVTRPDGSTLDHTERFTITNRNGEIFYISKNDGKKHVLPGYELADDMCLLTTGKLLAEMDTEKKVLNIWNASEGQEAPTEVDCLTDLFGQDVLVAILKVRKNKQVADQSGKYINTADELHLNQISKFFHVDYKATVNELRKAEKANVKPEDIKSEFYDKWLDKNQGKERDEYKEVIGASSGQTFSGTAGSASSAQSRIFGRRAG